MNRARVSLANFHPSDLPRAELAVNLSDVTPVAIKSPTLIAANDPYNSMKPVVQPEPAPQPAQTAENQKTNGTAGVNEVKSASNTTNVNPPISETPRSATEIRKAIPVESVPKAIPVQPQDRQPAEIRRAIPVKPLDQEDGERTLFDPQRRHPRPG